MYDNNFDISNLISMIDIMIFCNIAPHSILSLSTKCAAALLSYRYPSLKSNTSTCRSYSGVMIVVNLLCM